MQLEKGTQLQGGKYRIDKVLGQGGFGITYKASYKMRGQLGYIDVPIAIKEFFMKENCTRDTTSHAMTISTTNNSAMVEVCRNKFIKEANNLSKLDHPNIIKVMDIFEENSTVYYVMQYYNGGSLKSRIKSNGPFEESEALELITQVGNALIYMHEKRMCHLDVKPDNILLDADDNAVLIDFGISKNYDNAGNATSMTQSGLSPGYAPIEQYQAAGLKGFASTSDIYSLGATLYTLLTGNVPPESTMVITEGLGDKPDYISQNTWNVILKAMQPNKNNRYQTAKSMVEALNNPEPTVEEVNVLFIEKDEESAQQVSKRLPPELPKQPFKHLPQDLPAIGSYKRAPPDLPPRPKRMPPKLPNER